MGHKRKDGLFQAITGLFQVVTLILLVHCFQMALGLAVKVLSLCLLLTHPVI